MDHPGFLLDHVGHLLSADADVADDVEAQSWEWEREGLVQVYH